MEFRVCLLAREVMDVNLSGWDGGSIMGFENMMDRLEIYPPSDDAFLAHLFDLFTQKYIWPGLTEAEVRLLYTEGISKKVLGLAFEICSKKSLPPTWVISGNTAVISFIWLKIAPA